MDHIFSMRADRERGGSEELGTRMRVASMGEKVRLGKWKYVSQVEGMNRLDRIHNYNFYLYIMNEHARCYVWLVTENP
jgi:hypothetical protein